jgi:hypothetical protein|tara:strand:+ start:55 stop:399 length:345 start_codon:yes stop_codon:yes gene_type:complete
LNAKRLEPDSEYAKYDADGDGIVSDEEIAASERLQTLELQNEKADAQRNMCWFALWGMLLYPSLVLVSSYLELDKGADILGSMSSIYYISVAGVVSVWFGSQAYTSSKNGKNGK